MPSGKQVARFALRDGRTVFFVIFAAPDIPAVAHHDIDAQKGLLRRLLGDMGWECPEILNALDSVGELYFDSVTQFRLSQWHRGRIALVGDAACCPSLLAGERFLPCHGRRLSPGGRAEGHGRRLSAAYSSYQGRFKPFIEHKQRLAARFLATSSLRERVSGCSSATLRVILLDAPLVGDMIAKRMFADRFALPDYS